MPSRYHAPQEGQGAVRTGSWVAKKNLKKVLHCGE
jgi:hypothetical protein